MIDPNRRLLPDAVLVCGSADGYMRLWSVREVMMLAEVHACADPRPIGAKRPRR